MIGAQKAGSTYVQDALDSHPDVYVAPGEIDLFQHSVGDAALEALRDIMAGRRRGQIGGIKRPDYLARADCAARIHATLPDVKLLVSLRDPVERAISAYFHYMLHGLLPIKPVDLGLTQLLDASADFERYPRAPEILEYGFYARHLDAYSKYFDARDVEIVVYDELRSRPSQTISRMFRFLGVRDDVEVKRRRANPTVYSLWRIRAIRRIAAPLSLHRGDGRQRRIPGVVGALQRLDARAPRPRAELSAETLIRLRALYASDVQRLRDEYRLSVDGWLKEKT
jgi:hypothetical protein